MLIGHYFQNLSSKGRVALPATFRKELGRKVILSRWYENSLAIFETGNWVKIVEQATAGLSVSAPARDTERFLLGGAYEVELDSQGRFVIPQAARTFAKLGKDEVVFVGLGNRVEIWSKKAWKKKEKEIIAHAEELVEKARNHV